MSEYEILEDAGKELFGFRVSHSEKNIVYFEVLSGHILRKLSHSA